MSSRLVQEYQITLVVPDDMEFFEAQERVLQNFPERVAGIEIGFVKISAGYVDSDSAPSGPRVPK